MWIMSVYGFFSIVADKDKSGNFQVRSRQQKDLENLRRAASLASPVIVTMQADYPARLVIAPTELVDVLYALGKSVDYPNFKTAIHQTPDQSDKNGAYMDIWSTMRRTEKDRPELSQGGRSRFGGTIPNREDEPELDFADFWTKDLFPTSEEYSTCPKCGGFGDAGPNNDPCLACAGTGRVEREENAA